MIANFFPRPLSALLIGASLFCLLTGKLSAADAPDDPIIQAAFENGTLTEGQQSLEEAMAGHADPNDPAAVRERYALAMVQFVRSAEKMGQAWRHYGLNVNAAAADLPFLRLPVGSADPASIAPISYENFRAVFVNFLADVQTAERAFANLPDDPGKVSMRPALVRIDYVGDGKAASTETLWRTYERLHHGTPVTEQEAGQFLIKFDAGDVPWFRGYCHGLSALAEAVLAYDESRLFDHTAQLFFARPITRFPFLLTAPGNHARLYDPMGFVDFVAFIHLMNFPVREPARLTAALDDLSQIPALSRESWRRILAETDDDHEWIPNPKQTGVLPGMAITQEKIDAWLKTMDEVDAILAGRKLLPFWRGPDNNHRGVNLRRVFTEPTDFDLVLWAQGTGAAPYLENGTLTDTQLWHEINDAFSGEMLGFAFYFN